MSGEPERPPAVLRSSGFRWYFAGRTVSMAGSFMAPVALAFGVLERTGSASWLAAVTAAALIPTLATMLLGGGLADRHRRDAVLSLAALGAGLAQAGVAFVLLTDRHPALLLPLAACGGICQGLTRPAQRGILANLATGRGLQRASSLLATSANLARILGPSAAGLLTASVGGGWALAVDAASFLVAAACFARIALPAPPPRGSAMLADLREGWRYFRTEAWIWPVTLAFAVFNATNLGFWQILGPVIAQDTIGPRGWGLVLSARGAGALLAGAVLVKVPLPRRPMTPALSAMALATLPLLLLGLGAGLWWLVAASLPAGVAAESFTVAWETVTNARIPERLLSRVGAHDEFWSTLAAPLGQLSAPILAAAFGTAAVAVTGAVVAAAAMVLTGRVWALRRLSSTDERPPARS